MQTIIINPPRVEYLPAVVRLVRVRVRVSARVRVIINPPRVEYLPAVVSSVVVVVVVVGVGVGVVGVGVVGVGVVVVPGSSTCLPW